MSMDCVFLFMLWNKENGNHARILPSPASFTNVRLRQMLIGYARVLSVTLFRRGFLGLFLIDRGSICHIDPSSSES